LRRAIEGRPSIGVGLRTRIHPRVRVRVDARVRVLRAAAVLLSVGSVVIEQRAAFTGRNYTIDLAIDETTLRTRHRAFIGRGADDAQSAGDQGRVRDRDENVANDAHVCSLPRKKPWRPGTWACQLTIAKLRYDRRMRGLIGSLGLVGGGLAIAIAMSCGSESQDPTQIIVSVESTPAECPIIQDTIVRVDTLDDFAPAAGEKAGCDARANHIGEFVLVPKGALDAEVQFQVVTGVAKNPDECKSDDIVDCIFAKRISHFVPHQTIRLTVLMSGACRGKSCDTGETCDDTGQCVAVVATGSSSSGSVSGSVDSGGPIQNPNQDAGPPTPEQVCKAAGCEKLPTGTCGKDGTCQANCGTNQNCNLVCPPGLSCVFKCGASDACGTVSCDSSNPSCNITCSTSSSSSACSTVTCASNSCTIGCTKSGSSSNARGCDNVTASSAKTTTISCGQNGCGTIDCKGPGVCDCPQSHPDQCNGGSTLCNTCKTSSGD
jgi:hypothetical protein